MECIIKESYKLFTYEQLKELCLTDLTKKGAEFSVSTSSYFEFSSKTHNNKNFSLKQNARAFFETPLEGKFVEYRK